MNPKPLLKHFPELEHLSPEQQEALLTQAHEEATGPARRLETWRNNIFALVVVSALSLLVIFWLGPALGLPNALSAVVVMVVVLPAFIYVQQRRYIERLKRIVPRLLREAGRGTQNAER